MEIIIHHTSESVFDKTAREQLNLYLDEFNESVKKAIIKFIKQTKQSFTEYEMVFFLNAYRKDIKFRKTAEEAYTDALDEDIECPIYIRWWVKDGILNLVTTLETCIFSDIDYDDLYDKNGLLQQFVKDAAIKEVKKALLLI